MNTLQQLRLFFKQKLGSWNQLTKNNRLIAVSDMLIVIAINYTIYFSLIVKG